MCLFGRRMIFVWIVTGKRWAIAAEKRSYTSYLFWQIIITLTIEQAVHDFWYPIASYGKENLYQQSRALWMVHQKCQLSIKEQPGMMLWMSRQDPLSSVRRSPYTDSTNLKDTRNSSPLLNSCIMIP